MGEDPHTSTRSLLTSLEAEIRRDSLAELAWASESVDGEPRPVVAGTAGGSFRPSRKGWSGPENERRESLCNGGNEEEGMMAKDVTDDDGGNASAEAAVVTVAVDSLLADVAMVVAAFGNAVNAGLESMLTWLSFPVFALSLLGLAGMDHYRMDYLHAARICVEVDRDAILPDKIMVSLGPELSHLTVEVVEGLLILSSFAPLDRCWSWLCCLYVEILFVAGIFAGAGTGALLQLPSILLFDSAAYGKMLLTVVSCLVSGMLINAAALVRLLLHLSLPMQICLPFVAAFGCCYAACYVVLALCCRVLVAVGLCLEEDCFWMCPFRWLWNQLGPVLLVLHPDACIAGLGVWCVAVGFCFFVLLVSEQEQSAVVPCHAPVEFCVSANACCSLFRL
ncbi:hypothetical protein Nepgr_032252 [Nepenthes gracilis]|uniref:Transmembrane protein n=1 Tax=Nepenthes gracilis TaxID=150966 RepID=A0AAD3TJR7_NEPGR|nr:hypothetical protein Nepgr_032252 [Nepenthes gracilis]